LTCRPWSCCCRRPGALLQFTHNARQQLLRAAALLYDPRKLGFVETLQAPAAGVLDVCATQARGLAAAADELFKAAQELRLTRTPLFCVHTALDILGTGGCGWVGREGCGW
jgi:hypothetical protein